MTISHSPAGERRSELIRDPIQPRDLTDADRRALGVTVGLLEQSTVPKDVDQDTGASTDSEQNESPAEVERRFDEAMAALTHVSYDLYESAAQLYTRLIANDMQAKNRTRARLEVIDVINKVLTSQRDVAA